MSTNNKDHKDAIKQYADEIRPLVRIDQRKEAEWRFRKILEHTKDLVQANQVTPAEHSSVKSERDRLRRENTDLYEAVDKAEKEAAAKMEQLTQERDRAKEAADTLFRGLELETRYLVELAINVICRLGVVEKAGQHNGRELVCVEMGKFYVNESDEADIPTKRAFLALAWGFLATNNFSDDAIEEKLDELMGVTCQYEQHLRTDLGRSP